MKDTIPLKTLSWTSPLFHTAIIFHLYFSFPFRCLSGVVVSGTA